VFLVHSRSNREAFLRDERNIWRVSASRAAASRDQITNVLALLEAGGNIYYLAKFAGIFHLGGTDIGRSKPV